MIDKREKIIIKTSIIVLIVNILIGIIQLAIGFFSNSIAIINGGIKSLSGGVLAIINIIGIKLAHKPADKKHPYGYGRKEYFTNIYLAIVLVILALIAIYESAIRINSDIKPFIDVNYAFAVFISVASIVKLVLGRYTVKKGKESVSKSLTILGDHSFGEVILEAITVITILITIATNIHIDSYIGIFISIVLLKDAFMLIKDTIDTLIGIRIDDKLAKNIKTTIKETNSNIEGAYDLIVHDYGVNTKIGTCNVELNEDIKIKDADKILHKLQRKILDVYNIYLVFGIYSVNRSDEKYREIRETIGGILSDYKEVVNFHALYIEEKEKNIRFDLVITFGIKDEKQFKNKIIEEIKKVYNYNIFIKIEHDVSD